MSRPNSPERQTMLAERRRRQLAATAGFLPVPRTSPRWRRGAAGR